jgi:hypothetical protein
MAKKKQRDAFEVKISTKERKDLALWLCDEVQGALDAKASADVEVDYWHRLYEQGRTRQSNMPHAADLTSYLATQNVDALHARLMKTINVEPIWTVEGWGQTAQNSPFVEEFHQWKSEEEGLQGVFDRLGLISLIEPRGLLEVREGTQMRRVRKETFVALELVPTGAIDPMTGAPEMVPVFDEKGQPKLQSGPDGKFVTPTDPSVPAVKVVVDSLEPIRSGPQYRVIPYRDSVILPGHARDKDEIWGYGKRFWKRMPELKEMAAQGVYDTDALETLTATSDREPEPSLQRAGADVARQEGDTAEKELWEVLLLKDLDGKGERWYLATIHLGQQTLLRLQHDDVDRSRFVLFNLFPRPDRATEGFSLIGHKLITTIEEHTAVRNMRADRSTMAAQAPIKRLIGALWDPLEQPWGASSVIDVRDMREVEPVQVPDVPPSVIDWERACERTAERLVGVNDIASGQAMQESKTLGEVQMATEQSFVRMDLVIRRFQEAMEDLAAIRHAIWKRVLSEQPDGIEPPQGVMVGLEARGMALPGGRMTAQMLEGQFRFKPRGSVETADPRALRADFNQMLQALPALIQASPFLQQALLMNPQAARALLEQFVRVYRIPNRQAFLSGAVMIDQQAQQMQMMQQAQQMGLLPPGPPQGGPPQGQPGQ